MKKHRVLIVASIIVILDATLAPAFCQWYTRTTGMDNIGLIILFSLVGFIAVLVPAVEVVMYLIDDKE